jgi:hypothetical protein
MTRQFIGLFLVAAAVAAQDEVATFKIDTPEVDLYVSVGRTSATSVPR